MVDFTEGAPMILPVLCYGHPALRQKGVRLDSLSPENLAFIQDLLDTMKDARGVGLASQQVGRALQLAVVDVRGVTDRPSTLSLRGETVDVDAFMPLVLVNPEIKPIADPVEGPEGCLSFPEIYAPIGRPDSIEVKTTNELGRVLEFRCSGLLARAIQHEHDHLQGILFIDRMTRKAKLQVQDEIDLLQAKTKTELKKKSSF